MRAIRRVHTSGIKVEVVSARSSHAIISRRRPARRPPVAVLASVPRLTIVWIEVPAAHEDYTSSNFTNRPEDTYLYSQAYNQEAAGLEAHFRLITVVNYSANLQCSSKES